MLPGHGTNKAVESFQWPMVKLECLKLHLKKKRAHVTRKLNNHHHVALTAQEEEELVKTLIYTERVVGGWNLAELSDAVVTIVYAHHYINKHPTPGRPFVRLRMEANTIRVNRRVGKAWFTRFFVDQRHLILERKLHTLAAIHAERCTRQRSLMHFTQLGEKLRNFGLTDSTGLIKKPANVINYDECPNMINGIQNGNGGKIIGGLSGSSKTTIGEEHAYNVIMMATCGLYGHKYKPQLNYARKTLDPGLFPTKTTTLDDFWVSVTKKDTRIKERFYYFSKCIIQDV